MLQILVNNKVTDWTKPLPEKVTALRITHVSNPFQPMLIPQSEMKVVQQWLNDLIDRCVCETVVYNERIVKVSELTRFKLKEDNASTE